VDEALLGPEPAQSAVVHEPAREFADVGEDLVHRGADDGGFERPDRLDHHLVAAADGERKRLATVPVIG
jgi:hypothetical protein